MTEPNELPDSNIPAPPPRAPAESAPPPMVPPQVAEAAGHADEGRAPAQRSRSALPVLVALGFLLLLAGLAFLWNEQQGMEQRLAEQARRVNDLSLQPAPAPPPPPPSVDPGRVATLERQLAALEKLVASQPLTPPAPQGPTADDLQKLESRLVALEDRKPPPPPDTAGLVAPLAQKLDTIANEAAAAKSADADNEKHVAENAKRLTDLDNRLKQAEQQQSALADRATQAKRVALAQVALAAGEPVGSIPNAPPALSRFADAKPPTEAALRLSFPAAADAAEDASRPSAEGKTLGERMWLRARALVTVKRGDTVLVGAPAATVLSEAHAKLEAGDLAGAVATLDGLDGAAAQAMASWRAQAQSLLDARAALTQMARA